MEKNRHVEIREKLNMLKHQCKPTDVWEDLLETDVLYQDVYTDEGIQLISTSLDAFIDNILKLDSYSDSNEVNGMLKTLILELNGINNESDLIGVEEREQLYNFICEVLETIKFEYDDATIDKYRMW
ncbi:MAG: hypothetical protein KKH01_04990 [Firmicutes bacterium]|nr:hypothetical protein [Bacillota bacterium]